MLIIYHSSYIKCDGFNFVVTAGIENNNIKMISQADGQNSQTYDTKHDSAAQELGKVKKLRLLQH